jgi:hypothetical protein
MAMAGAVDVIMKDMLAEKVTRNLRPYDAAVMRRRWPGSRAAGIAMAHKLINAARARSRAVNATDQQAA